MNYVWFSPLCIYQTRQNERQIQINKSQQHAKPFYNFGRQMAKELLLSCIHVTLNQGHGHTDQN